MKSKFKKPLFLLLAFLMLFAAVSTAACGQKVNQGNDQAKPKSNINIGDIFTFGAYDQDNNEANGKEPIEWIVLDKDGDALLIISKYALDSKPFNTEKTDITWENCSLRSWLNDTFYNEAFSATERNMIKTSKVTADRTPDFDMPKGNDAEDKVFLLSFSEAEKYFSSFEDRRCGLTARAEANGAFAHSQYSANGRSCCWWWLRSLGDNYRAAYVNYDGVTISRGNYVNLGNHTIRPVLRIDPTA